MVSFADGAVVSAKALTDGNNTARKMRLLVTCLKLEIKTLEFDILVSPFLLSE